MAKQASRSGYAGAFHRSLLMEVSARAQVRQPARYLSWASPWTGSVTCWGRLGRRARHGEGARVLAAGPVGNQNRGCPGCGIDASATASRALPAASAPSGRDDRASLLWFISPAGIRSSTPRRGLGADRERLKRLLHRGVRGEAMTVRPSSPGKWKKRYPAIIRLGKMSGKNSCNSWPSNGK